MIELGELGTFIILCVREFHKEGSGGVGREREIVFFCYFSVENKKEMRRQKEKKKCVFFFEQFFIPPPFFPQKQNKE